MCTMVTVSVSFIEPNQLKKQYENLRQEAIDHAVNRNKCFQQASQVGRNSELRQYKQLTWCFAGVHAGQ